MKYKCLVLDHDDTIVNSTATIHYPAFLQALKQIRPNIHLSLDEYFCYNFEPGFTSLCEDILHFSQKEIDFQTQNWLKYVSEHTPQVYQGIHDILWEFKNQGGYICVVSHSMKENILRDYQAHDLPIPDMVFGWDFPSEQRKPSIYPLQKIKENLNIEYSDMVMIDDLKPGKIMADNINVDFIGAGWAHSIPSIQNYMQKECQCYCQNVEDLKQYIFED